MSLIVIFNVYNRCLSRHTRFLHRNVGPVVSMEDALKMTSGIGCGNALNEMTAKGIDEEYTHSGKGASVGRSAMEGSFETRERDTDVPVGVPAVVRLHTSPRLTRVTSSFETDDRGDRSGGGGGILVPPTESSRGGEVWFTYKRHRVVFVIDTSPRSVDGGQFIALLMGGIERLQAATVLWVSRILPSACILRLFLIFGLLLVV